MQKSSLAVKQSGLFGTTHGQAHNQRGESTPPFMVSVVPLSFDIDAYQMLHYLTDLDQSSIVNYSDSGIAHISDNISIFDSFIFQLQKIETKVCFWDSTNRWTSIAYVDLAKKTKLEIEKSKDNENDFAESFEQIRADKKQDNQESLYFT
ncbi:hypothetical protein Avbf_02021 [Armadillidium vulgare]|nr:hypothetical protein Avbf_02021 [Armadillidium vulgare]